MTKKILKESQIEVTEGRMIMEDLQHAEPDYSLEERLQYAHDFGAGCVSGEVVQQLAALEIFQEQLADLAEPSEKTHPDYKILTFGKLERFSTFLKISLGNIRGVLKTNLRPEFET